MTRIGIMKLPSLSRSDVSHMSLIDIKYSFLVNIIIRVSASDISYSRLDTAGCWVHATAYLPSMFHLLMIDISSTQRGGGGRKAPVSVWELISADPSSQEMRISFTKKKKVETIPIFGNGSYEERPWWWICVASNRSAAERTGHINCSELLTFVLKL